MLGREPRTRPPYNPDSSRKIKINRAATVWLIRRFIDPEAVLVFVSAGEVAAEARRLEGIGFHAPGTHYPARDERGRTPFDTLVEERCPTTRHCGAWA